VGNKQGTSAKASTSNANTTKKANTGYNPPDTSTDNKQSKMNMANWLKVSNDKNKI